MKPDTFDINALVKKAKEEMQKEAENNQFKYEENRIFCSVNADRAELNTYGYFANNLGAIKKALREQKTNLSCLYSCLRGVLKDSYEKRFVTDSGTFALFYPLDKIFDINRY